MVDGRPLGRRWAPWAGAMGLACLAVVLVAPHNSSLGNARLKLEDHWLRTTMGEEKLWYGTAAGKAGVVLGTWASQRQHQVRGSHSDDDDRPMAALRKLGRKLGFPEPGPAVPLSGLQQRQFQQGQEQHACSDKCRADYETAQAETQTLPRDIDVAKLHAQCIAMMRLFDCECTMCSPNMTAADVLQLTMCSPAGRGQLYEAGGPCLGFAHGFCGTPISKSNFCQSKTWVPQIGSPAWMQIHKVVDSGADAAAGEHLASNQEPGYALKVSNALAMYLRSGAMQELAETRVNSEIASQIESLKPVKMNMGFWNFLPIEVPFLEQVDKNSQEELQVEHDEQEADFGEELTPALARDYSKKLKDFSASLRDRGVELPADMATKLKELENAADRYNGPEDTIPWTRCAEEAAVCTCSGTVRYGTQGRWTRKKLTDLCVNGVSGVIGANVSGATCIAGFTGVTGVNVMCSVAQFDSDPAPGIVKTCECQSSGSWLPSWL